jgi:cytochrome c oxidase subunit 2
MFLNVSNFVEGVDKAFVFILAICLFFLVGLTLVMLFFIYRYNKKRNPKASQIHGSTSLEIIWTVVPLILVLAMFAYGWTGWKPMKEKAPDDAIQITAVGRMWSFGFE